MKLVSKTLLPMGVPLIANKRICIEYSQGHLIVKVDGDVLAIVNQNIHEFSMRIDKEEEDRRGG